MVSENPIMSSSILACISQWGDVFQSGNVVDKEHEEHGECAEYVYRGNPLGC